MKRWMVLSAIGLVLAINVLVLAGVAWNRGGEPQAVLELTERELAMPWANWPHSEDSSIALRLVRVSQENTAWLDRDILLELGFDPDRFSTDTPRDRWREVERGAWVVLEYDGPAFQALLTSQREALETTRAGAATGEYSEREVQVQRQRLESLSRGDSRLAAIDAGSDPHVLRSRYPDRRLHAVVRARIRMHAIHGPHDETLQVRGRIAHLLPNRVYVPRRFHAELEQATEAARRDYLAPPRYRAELRFGRRGEPWLADIKALPAADSESDH